MIYYLLQIGNSLYYNQTTDRFTCYKESATWYTSKRQASDICNFFDKYNIVYELIEYKKDEGD